MAPKGFPKFERWGVAPCSASVICSLWTALHGKDCTTMVPETRLCAYCKSKIPPEKRADAKFCSHACKLSAHRKEERADAAHKESVAPMQPVVTKPIELPSVLAPQDHICFNHPTRFPLTLEELERAAPERAALSIGLSSGTQVESPQARVGAIHLSQLRQVGVRFDGTRKCGHASPASVRAIQ